MTIPTPPIPPGQPPELAGSFERLFGTSHGVDVGVRCIAVGTAQGKVASIDELRDALRPETHHRIRVVEVRTDRSRRCDLDCWLRESLADALRS
jgi:2-succinyl-5-enolpyruvyl-6-hydroxy-3-cyclohexene-1-carboxylate synthase